MAFGGAKVRIYGDWDGSGVKKAERDLGAFERQVGGFSSSVKKSFLGVGAAIGGLVAVGSVVNYLKDATQAAIEDEKSMVALAQAMENVGLASQNAGVERFVNDLMFATGVADDQLRPALQRLITVTGDVTTSQNALRLALDVAAGTGRDLDSVTTALAKAYGGQTTALQRLGVGLDASILKSKDMDAITAALSDKFSGQAAAAAGTYQGMLNRLNVAFSELSESLGYGFLNAIDDASGQTNDLVDVMRDLQPVMQGVGRRIGETTSAVLTIGLALEDMAIGAGKNVDEMSTLQRIINYLINDFPLFWNGLETVATILEGWRGETDGVTVALGSQDGQLRMLIRTMDQYIPMVNSATRSNYSFIRSTGAATDRLTAQARAYGADISFMGGTLNEWKNRANEAAGGARKTREEIVKLDDAMRRQLQGVNRSAVAYDQLTRSLGADEIAAFSRKMLATGEITAKTKDEFEDMVGTIRDRLNSALDSAKQKLGEWQTKYNDTLKTVSQGIRDGNSIADAAEAQAEATRALADAQREYDEAVAGDDPKRLAEAGDALAKARSQQGTFIKFLQRGANAAEAFGDQIQQLIRANAALEVVQDIAALGARTGSRVAAELLAGGSAAIEEANRLVATVGRAANDAGVLAAQTFYGAGLASAQAYVSALETQVRPLLQSLLNQIAAQISAALKVPVNANIGGPAPAPEPPPTPAAPAPFVPILTPQQFRATAAGRPPSGEGRIFAEIRAFAEGGIVTRPTVGVFGEAGPEAVIPLDRMGSLGGTTINVTVNAGMGTDGAEVGRQIVDALKQYQRRNGPVPITVA